MDRAIAVLATRLGGGKLVDYMPWPKQPDLEEREAMMPEADTQKLMALVGGTVVKDHVVQGRSSNPKGMKWRREV